MFVLFLFFNESGKIVRINIILYTNVQCSIILFIFFFFKKSVKENTINAAYSLELCNRLSFPYLLVGVEEH